MEGRAIRLAGPEVTSPNLHIICSQNLKNRLKQGTSDCDNPGEHNGALDQVSVPKVGKRRQFEDEAARVCQQKCLAWENGWMEVS